MYRENYIIGDKNVDVIEAFTKYFYQPIAFTLNRESDLSNIQIDLLNSYLLARKIPLFFNRFNPALTEGWERPSFLENLHLEVSGLACSI
ncbi:MAG: hypothetical protein QW372_04125 [Nitrososphaerales archaeon]